MKSPDKHRKIIRAATKVFAKKGFFNARISDIAKEAKVADGTIYLYFNNKFDILLSVFEQEIGKLIYEEAQKDPRHAEMGTTIVGACLTQHIASVVHVGDSRAYLWHKGRVEPLTRDHSLVEAQIRAGLLGVC